MLKTTVLDEQIVFSSQGPVWITPGHTLQIASVSANLLFKKSLAEAKSMLFRLCTAQFFGCVFPLDIPEDISGSTVCELKLVT